MAIYRNQSWAQSITIKNGTTPFNLTNVPLAIQFRLTPDTPEALVTMSTTNGKLTVPAPLTGVVNLFLTEEDTALLPAPAVLHWDCIRVDTKQRLFGGTLATKQGVTRNV